MIDLSKQQAFDADLKIIQQIDFTANLDQAGDTMIFFYYEETKDYCEGIVNVSHKLTIAIFFCFI